MNDRRDLPTSDQITAPYYSISQLRIDQWHALKHNAQDLATMGGKEAENGKKQEGRVVKLLKNLRSIERYFATPGLGALDKLSLDFDKRNYQSMVTRATSIIRTLVSDSYIIPDSTTHPADDLEFNGESYEEGPSKHGQRHFEVLFVEDLSRSEETALKEKLHELADLRDEFSYDVVVQPSFQDALIALLFNHNIQAVVIRYAPEFRSNHVTPLLEPYIHNVLDINFDKKPDAKLGPLLGRFVRKFRPEIDVYYVTDTSLVDLEEKTLQVFKRIYYRREDLQELHLSILSGVRERFETPFFSALMRYSKKPTGIFHAMPISRGNSIFKSRWLQDFGEFYGRNMFLAETSSTTGGLDSLLQPTGPLKKAQEMAARAYGSRRTFFVTNGTSTSNKIVLQGLVEPGDLVLIDRDCHKSHHYGLVLSGAYPVYLDSYPIEKYSMYGAVPVEEIVAKLIEIRDAGRLDNVKMLLLTNCTFDGIVYNVEMVMEHILAIKPDMIFLWDEAWFAFATFTLNYRQRTGMYAARKLHDKYSSKSYRARYERYKANLSEGEEQVIPDPDKVRIRVYSTQSTHKTLSSFRQGSMIHIWDEDFRKKSESTFLEAYMTHTSTSPNYQILASLDAGRRQVQFEGYELVERSIEMALLLRAKINDNELLRKYFDVLTVSDFINEKYRKSGIVSYYETDEGWKRMESAWAQDEFVLDPTKITLFIGRTGVDGDTFKNSYLMDQFNIQINKTSRNTVLLMTNIGTTRGSVAYLTNALLKIASQLEEERLALNQREHTIWRKRVAALTEEFPPLPDFSHFHSSFQAVPGVPGGSLRKAFFKSYDETNCDYLSLDECQEMIENGGEVVASSFVIPYPPGFPVLVPGQVISEDIIRFMMELDVKEIHGFRSDLGLRVFKPEVLDITPAAVAELAGAQEQEPISKI